MLLSQHTIVGMAVGLQTGNPFYGFTAGLAAHPVLDYIPHIDYNLIKIHHVASKRWTWDVWTVAWADAIITGIIIYFIGNATGMWWVVLGGAFGGALPDLIDHVPYWGRYVRRTGFGRWYERFHDGWHGRWEIQSWNWQAIGVIIIQLIITGGGIWVCFGK